MGVGSYIEVASIRMLRKSGSLDTGYISFLMSLIPYIVSMLLANYDLSISK